MGVVLAALGSLLVFTRFYLGIKPDPLNVGVFAVHSHYLESKHFEMIKNQIIEEIGGVLLIVGLFIVAFTKEKNENENAGRFREMRLEAFFISAYLNTIFLIMAMLFTFGFGFVYMMTINLVSGLTIYIVSFRVLLHLPRRP